MQKCEGHILSTAPLPESVLQEAAAQHLKIDVVPFIQTKPAIDAAMATRIRHLFQKPITVVFTSTNAVAAVAAIFQKPGAARVYAVGNATAKAAAQLFQMPIAGTADNAAALAEMIITDEIKEVIFFCGNKRRDELPEQLHKANILVQELVVYETVETPCTVENGYTAILFYSPSGVHSFFSANRLSPKTLLFAIGNTTATAIKRHTKHLVLVAQQPDKEAVVRQAIQYITTKTKKTE